MAQSQYELFRKRKEELRFNEFARKLETYIFHDKDLDGKSIYKKCEELTYLAYAKNQDATLLRALSKIKASRKNNLAFKERIFTAEHGILHTCWELRHKKETTKQFFEMLECQPLDFFEKFWLCYDPNKEIMPYGVSDNIYFKTHFHVNGLLLNSFWTNASVIARLRKAINVYLENQIELATDENGNIETRALKDLATQAHDLRVIDKNLIKAAKKHLTGAIEFSEDQILRSKNEIENNGKQTWPHVHSHGQIEDYNKKLIELEALPEEFTCRAMQKISELVEAEKHKNQMQEEILAR